VRLGILLCVLVWLVGFFFPSFSSVFSADKQRTMLLFVAKVDVENAQTEENKRINILNFEISNFSVLRK
jgi:hypothetical protein